MKVKFYFNSHIARLLSVGAITLYPFVFCREDEDYCLKRDTIAHEMVHVQQVRKLGWFAFYLDYLTTYFQLRFKGMDHTQAYYALPFEQEAYDHQTDKGLVDAYLKEKAK